MYKNNYSKFKPQSGEAANVTTEVSEADSSAKMEILEIHDQEPGHTMTVGSQYDSTMDAVATSDSSLGSFLSRPVRVKATPWVVGNTFFESFNPWTLFLTNTHVANKIASYELLRCKLHVRATISGTGFHYGRIMMSYNPLNGYDDVTISRDFLDADLVACSQRPHVFLNPTNNAGGQLDLPFFFQNNYMSLSKKDYEDMGEITVKSINSLKHANGGDDPVTVTIFVWATDVVLTMPTSITSPSTFSPQSGKKTNKKKSSKAMNSGDEYGQGIISGPASALANAAGALTAIPFIEPYARATQMVMTKVGQVAKIFGYSRPPVLTDIQLFKPSPTGNLANCDAADAVNKLTLDSKQEITIDSRTVGLDGQDEMSLKSIAMRESYLTQFNWSTSDAVDGLLWNSYVTPNLYRNNASEIHPTPMAMLAAYFNDWQGTIKFRFQIVKSNFHKGKLLIRWDPRSHSATPGFNNVYSRVVDIAEEDDFEIEIGWGQSVPFLGNELMNENNAYFKSSPRLPTDSARLFNGILEVDVLNALVSPAADADIQVNVFVSAGEDMKWGAPTADKLRTLHIFPEPTPASDPQVLDAYPSYPKDDNSDNIVDGCWTAQSGMMDVSGTTSTGTDRPVSDGAVSSMATPVLSEDDHQYEVFFGEAPVSLREIFRRYVYTRTHISLAPTADFYQVNTLRLKLLPYFTGYDPDGLDLNVATTEPLTVGQPHPLNFFMPCYAGWRGGIRKKLMFNTANNRNSPVVQRYPYSTSKGWIANYLQSPSAVADMVKFLSARFARFTNAGAAATNLGVNNTIEVEGPFYNGTRFASTRLPAASELNDCQNLSITTITANQADSGDFDKYTIIHDYTAVGEDFSLFFWSGTPILYRYTCDETT